MIYAHILLYFSYDFKPRVMKTKTYGIKTLVIFLLTGSWLYIIVGDEATLFLPTISIIVLLALVFVPLVHIRTDAIHLRSLNPFAGSIKIPFDKLERIHIHGAYIGFRIIFHLKDGTMKSSSNFFRYYDMEEVFEHLYEMGIDITSSGISTVTWKR